MKVLIVYDSLFGNTEKLALAIGENFASFHKTQIIKIDKLNSDYMRDIGLFIIGSPTHGGRFTEPIKNFFAKLSKNSFENIPVATFDTSFPSQGMGFFINHLGKIFGNAAPRLSKELTKHGANVIDSKIFYVLGKKGPLGHGEIERAQSWANELIKFL